MLNAISPRKLARNGISGCIHSPQKIKSKRSDIKNGSENISDYIAITHVMGEDAENQKTGKRNGGTFPDPLRKKYTLMIQKDWS